ncbi:MAG: amidohydrolase family protein, partial [Anaerovorax sp.]
VMAHIGLLPQTASMWQGYRVQGRDEDSAWQLVDAALALEEAGELTLRINYSEMIQPENYKEGIENLLEEKETVKSDFIKISTAKFFADGVIEGVTGYLLDPYTKEAGMGDNYVSEPIWTDKAAFADAMTMALDGDLQIHVLDCIEQAQTAHGDADYRNVITHLQVVNDADKPRFGELGIIAAIQPFWHMQEPDWYENVDKLVLGEDRAWKEYPVKSLLDNGAVITSSGDYPVSPTNNPLWGIESGVTRNLNNAEFYGVEDIANMDDPKWLLNAEERVSLKTM